MSLEVDLRYFYQPKPSHENSKKIVQCLEQSQGCPEIPSPLIVDDLMFMVNEGGVVSCVEAKRGNLVWKGRVGGNHWASPLYAGGNIYFFSMGGRVSVILAGREFKLLARNKFDGEFIASGAVAGNALILRSRTHLYCIEETNLSENNLK